MFPGIVYVGDVPVEASFHGSALLHRLLSDYPPGRLTIIETATASQPERRLPNINYISRPIGKQRWLNTRFHPYAVAWFTHAAQRMGQHISQSMNGFECESVLTVAHGFGWLAAAQVANKRRVPLHLIVHDDWPRVADIAPQFRRWLDDLFASVYRQAQSRLCVSPAMSRFYEQRYGAPAEVIYPSRAAVCADYDEPPAHLASNDKPFTIAFAGTINSDGYIKALIALQNALKPIKGRLLIFGPLLPDEAQQIGLHDPSTTICGFLTATDLLKRLRDEADALFVPMSFAPTDRANMEMAFPSKFADYTATGVPLVIYGPSYCSAVVWARENPGVAEIIEAETDLPSAIAKLANNHDHRLSLGKRALNIGREYFSHERVKQIFYQSLSV
ncbi:MAG TPA: glycosyltransferase [Pyrinomonadaceae bacterium]|nr:glycosyltransferase [Pyrinomonadaceae bacterium]